MNGISSSLSGDIRYTSHAPERFGAERGRESFRIDSHRGATGPMMAISSCQKPKSAAT